jgi:Uma2 family endonuclease
MAQHAYVLDPPLDGVILAYERDGPIPVSEETYVRLALDDPQIKWELIDGLLVEKPRMSITHLNVLSSLNYQLTHQLDFREFRVLVNDGRLRRTPRNYFIPDVSVVPSETIRRLLRTRPTGLGVFDDPLPFVAEARSPSTGRYDVNVKLPTYKLRGDQEIWLLHPFVRTVTAWRRRPDGEYDQLQFTSGKVPLHVIPHVVIDLDALFATAD